MNRRGETRPLADAQHGCGRVLQRLRLGVNRHDSILATICGVPSSERAGGTIPGSHRLAVWGPAGEEGLQFKQGVVRTQLAAMDVSRRARRSFAVWEPQLNDCFASRILRHGWGLLSSVKLLNQENVGVKNKILHNFRKTWLFRSIWSFSCVMSLNRRISHIYTHVCVCVHFVEQCLY